MIRRTCRHRLALLSLLLVPGFLAGSSAALAQGGPPPKVRQAIDAVVRMLEANDEASLTSFAEQRLAPTYRASFTPDALLEHLRGLRAGTQGATDTVMVERDEQGLHVILGGDGGQRSVSVGLAIDDAGAITRLELEPARTAAEAEGPPMSWDDLAKSFSAAEQEGFSGVVLAVRDGKTILRQAYGVTDRDSGRRTSLDTAYCIGSTPIDFTVTAIRLLGQRGKLRLEDPIGRYLTGVPPDKASMTIDHLLTGASGLPDFHHQEGKDWDPDLAWVDRDTAVARILAQPLLFAPGSDRQHSHSAFGLLTAIVEIVSGDSYAEFLRREIFTPAGMTRTGFYGETLGLTLADFATGYGNSAVGLPNIPPNWGPTSWLVMGSGGMFSTLGDMQRYYETLEAGRILTGEWLRNGLTVGVGGSDRGFYIFHAANGTGTRVLFLMNGEGRRPEIRKLQRGLEKLVR
jgi:CubicO group peptidase (beta-lactamase class C family)